MVDTWTVAEAKARFSEVLARSASHGPQTVAATAEVHDLTLVTRDESDFKSSVTAIYNPWGIRSRSVSE